VMKSRASNSDHPSVARLKRAMTDGVGRVCAVKHFNLAPVPKAALT
jgi:hypothetical protein